MRKLRGFFLSPPEFIGILTAMTASSRLLGWGNDPERGAFDKEVMHLLPSVLVGRRYHEDISSHITILLS